MNSQLRRTHILDYLTQADGPLSATALARTLQVSRQIIVGDVALLRATLPPSAPTRWPAATVRARWSRS